jgi:hypothetical protein
MNPPSLMLSNTSGQWDPAGVDPIGILVKAPVFRDLSGSLLLSTGG